MFRPRAYSKRRREDFDSDLERRFDLTRDYPPLVFPERQGIDVGAAAAALVEVSAMVPVIRELASADTVTVETKKIADFSLSVFTLLYFALSAGMRAAAVDKATEKKQDPAEAVRVADDALSLVTNMTFLGQASAPPNKEKHPDAKH